MYLVRTMYCIIIMSCVGWYLLCLLCKLRKPWYECYHVHFLLSSATFYTQDLFSLDFARDDSLNMYKGNDM